MDLIIVESPTKARTLSRFLGDGYTILASVGHVRDLPKKELGIDLEHHYQPKYQVISGKSKVLAELRSAAARAGRIILATDPDREGEAIAYHLTVICSSSKFKVQSSKFQRITFHEITKEAVREALRHPGTINIALVEAQQARRVLDRLVGYKLSPLLWRKVRRGLSAGRVQSVAVRLIVDREKEIRAFVPENYWEFLARLYPSAPEQFLTAKLVKINEKKAVVKDQAAADRIDQELKKAAYAVSQIDTVRISKTPPPPFTTSTLQQMAAILFHYSAKKTMSTAQRLYEAGLITYHRTDAVTLSSQALAMLRDHITGRYGTEYLPPQPRQYKTKSKSAQEAHEAIRPTKVGPEPADLAPDESKLLRLITNRAVASQMAAAQLDKQTVDITAAAGENYLLRKVSYRVVFDGYQRVSGVRIEENDPESGVVRQLQPSRKLTLKELLAEAKQTEPPARYSEAMLIKALEEKGIGRPSTYAPIITTIQRRMYVEKKEGRFHPTPIGIAVNDYLAQYFPKIMDYDFTARLEDDLDRIADAAIKWDEVVDGFYRPFAATLDEVAKKSRRVEIPVEKTGEKCPDCQTGDQVIRVGKFGKFLSCSRFPECKWKGKYREVVPGIKCPECGSEILMRQTRFGKRFYGCAGYPKCKYASWRKPK